MRVFVFLPAPVHSMQRNFMQRVVVRLAVVLGFFGLGVAGAQVVTAFPGSTKVNQSSAPVSVTVTMSTAGVAAAPKAFAQGPANGEFNVAAGGTCAAGQSYAVGATCTVELVFTPLFPGVRVGAVEVAAGNGTMMGVALVGGVGVGSLPVLAPGGIQTVAGDAEWIYQGDGEVATDSPIFLPGGVIEDAAGNLFIADTNNNRIRRVDAVTGLMSTIAGTGAPGYNGDGIPATEAEVATPAGLVMDGAGNLYFADTGNHIVRRIDAVTGLISTVAGTPGVQGYGGDGAAATEARLSFPQSVAFDAVGDLVIADTSNNVVRRVDAVTGYISTIAGTGVAGYNGDGQQATAAQLNSPWGVVVGQDGSVYVADLFNNRVRKVLKSGTISTVAGTGTKAFSGDDGPGIAAELAQPTALAMDPAGDLFIADSDNNRVREVSATSGNIVTLSGTDSEQFSGDGGPANMASLYGPDALFFDAKGTLFVADMFHNRVRAISGLKTALVFPTMKVGKISAPQPITVANDGNADLVLAMPGLENAATDPATTTCAAGASVAAAGSCVVGVEFAPTVTGNPVTGMLTVNSNAVTAAPLVNLSGEVLSITPTTVALVSSQNPSLLGAAVTFTATINNDGGGALSGTVVFYDGTTQICSVTVTGSGAACTTSALTLGSHSVTAAYSGDANDAAATSPVLTQVVQQLDALALTATPNPAVVTEQVILTLTITAPTGTPTGAVTFLDGTTAIGAGALTGGVASFKTSTLTPGTHSLTATYAGDGTNAAGKSNAVSLVVQQATTSTVVATSSATAAVGTAVTFTATVASANGPAPTGTVQFTDGGVALGTGTLGSNGEATFTTSSLAPGTHSIAAVYAGDTDDATSTSAAISEVIQQIGTTTVLAATPNPA
jgi:sugar lactone lactonase YvrE/predicted secreted protein